MNQQPLHLLSDDYFISPSNTVTVERRANQLPFPLHHHDFHELVIVSAGNGLHIWNDIVYPITCGDIFYINPEDHHGYESACDLRLDNILYHRHQCHSRSLIESYLPALDANERDRYWQMSTCHLSQLIPLINMLIIESSKPDMLSIHLSETLFTQLIINLYRFRYQPDHATLTITHQLDILLNTLHSSITCGFNLEHFCQKQHSSPRSLRRLFKSKTGMTISNYLQQLRLCRAMTLLRNSQYSINAISAQCGYEDSNYFSSVFTQKVGITPSGYRGRFVKANPIHGK